MCERLHRRQLQRLYWSRPNLLLPHVIPLLLVWAACEWHAAKAWVSCSAKQPFAAIMGTQWNVGRLHLTVKWLKAQHI